MSYIKSKIQELLAKHGAKLFTKMVKKDVDIMAELAPLLSSDKTLSQVCYDYVHAPDTMCGNGNQLKFKSYVDGYKFCGRAGVCKCAKDAVSSAVSKTKAAIADDAKISSNTKRKETNLAKYGVVNIGTSIEAKAARALTANDPEKMVIAREKYKDTMIDRYGVDNGLKLEKVTERRHIDNAMLNPESVAKGVATRKDNYDQSKVFGVNYARIKSSLSSVFDIELLTTFDNYIGVVTRPTWEFKCNKCAHTWSQRYDHANYPECKNCKPLSLISYKSKQELSILTYVTSIYSGVVISGDRSIINPYEVDIYLPELHLAIEFCGLYWHSEKSSGKGYSYHKNKMTMLNDKGIRLITIFSDELEQNQELVFGKIKNVIGLDTCSIFARKTKVSVIDRDSGSEFLTKYHIQGPPKRLPINYGLFHNNILIAVMSFVKQSDGVYELVRFATNIRIVGGASKLMSKFISDYLPDSIISFADLRWSDGNLYNTLGFKEISRVPAMQSYVEKYSIRYHKLAFSKQKLLNMGADPLKTEWENMQSFGYDRIWDCGKIKYEWTK